MRVVGLGEVMALRSCDACRLGWGLHLDDSDANVVGLLLELVMVATQGALIDLTVGMGACGCMEHVICLLSLVWGMGMLAGA